MHMYISYALFIARVRKNHISTSWKQLLFMNCTGFLGGGRCKRHGFDSWIRKISWRRAWHPTPIFLPGESHGQRSLVGYSPWGHRVEHN